MKILFFGTPDFAVPSLRALALDPEIDISAVFTQEDKPVGRKQIITSPPVKTAAIELGIPVLQPQNKQELITSAKDYPADFYIVIAYGVIFPPELLELPKNACINAHASLLPKYRGASPIQESLLHGDTETGITFIRMNNKLDTGDVYLARRVPIYEEDTSEKLSARLSEITAELFPPLLKDIINNNLPPIPQKEKDASYCRKIKSTDGEINWNLSAKEISNLIRAYTPWPGAYTILDGKKFKIVSATHHENETGEPGKFIITKNQLKIITGKGALVPKTVQLEGKKEVDIKNFLNGYRFK